MEMEQVPHDIPPEQPPAQSSVTLPSAPPAAVGGVAIADSWSAYSPSISPCSSFSGNGSSRNLFLPRFLSKPSPGLVQAAQVNRAPTISKECLDVSQRERDSSKDQSSGVFGPSQSQLESEEGFEGGLAWSSFDLPKWLRWMTPDEGGQKPCLDLKKRLKKEADARALKELTSFDGCPELLRGTPLNVVMRSQAAIMQDSCGTDETWKLSKVVSGRLCTFISHNWSVHRKKKFLCLALHFNFRTAVGVVCLYLLLVTVLHGLGSIPLIETDHESVGFAGRAFTIPVFLAILLFARDIFPTKSFQPNVFLDKTCIHQADAALQRRGILKLGAFLHHSDEMLICYSDVYLSKLWTIFELGCFYCVGQTRNITILPTAVPCSLTICLCLAYPCEVFELFWHDHMNAAVVIPSLIWYGFLYAMAIYFCQIEKNKERIRSTLASFSIRNSQCSKESDRPLVYSCIAALLRSTGRVDELATQDEALTAFDEIVRGEMPGLFGDCLQPMGTKTRDIIMCTLIAVLPRAADAAGAVHSGMTWTQWVGQHLLVGFTHGGCAIPLAMLLLWAVASRLTAVEGVARYVGFSVSTIFPTILVRFSRVALEELGEACDSVWRVALFFVGYSLFQVAVCALFAFPPRMRRMQKALSNQSGAAVTDPCPSAVV